MNKIQKFIVKKFTGLTEEQLHTLAESVGITIDKDDYQYRKYGSNNTKGLNILTRDRQLELAFRAYLTDPIAKFILDTKVDFVCGDGFSYSFSVDTTNSSISPTRADEIIKQLEEIAKEFWKKNNMNLRWEKKVLDQRMNGMLILPAFINQVNGSVKIGFIDPKNLDKVETNPMNVEDITNIKLKGIAGNTPKLLKVIREDDDPQSASFGLLDGETFYFAINNVSNQPEGIGDLLTNLDTLDIMRKVLYKIVMVIDVHLAYTQHVKMKGDEKARQKFKTDNPFSTDVQRVITDKETEIEVLNPDLKNLDVTEILRFLKNITLGSHRIPENWLGDGGNTNLATAKEQDEPTMRMFRKIQQQVVFMLQEILTFSFHQALLHKRAGFTITKEELAFVNIDIKRPELERRDFKKIGEALAKIQELLEKAVNASMLSQETATAIFISLVDIIGYDLDKDSETGLIEKEQKAKKDAAPTEGENGKKTKTEEPAASGE